MANRTMSIRRRVGVLRCGNRATFGELATRLERGYRRTTFMTTQDLVTIFIRVRSDNPTASVEEVADALVTELGLAEVDVALSEHYVFSDAEGEDIRLMKLHDSEVYRELERQAEQRPDLWNAIGGDSNEVRVIAEARRLGRTPRRMGPPIVFERGECTEAGHERAVAWVKRFMASNES